MITPVGIDHAKQHLGGEYTPHAQALGFVVDGELFAVATYDHWNGVSMQFNIWIGKKPSAEWSQAIFAYPFDQLGVKKLIGNIFSSNAKSIKLAEHSGFELEATIKDMHPKGDMLIYTMTRDQCVVLNKDKWRAVA